MFLFLCVELSLVTGSLRFTFLTIDQELETALGSVCPVNFKNKRETERLINYNKNKNKG